MVADGALPRQLVLLLENPRIWKTGRLIEGDIKRLCKACPSSRIQYKGIHDLAVVAKEKGVYRNIKNIGLADLSARVLHKRLNKNVAERTSSWWTNPSLTPEQIQYAALDAYASLQIFNVLNALETPKVVSEIEDQGGVGVPVLLQAGDKRSVVARGRIAQPLSERGRAMVTVLEVFQKAARVPNERSCLDSYGDTPFTIPYPSNHILTYTPLPPPPSRPDNLEIPQDFEIPSTDSRTSPDSGQANQAPVDYPPGHEVDAASAAFGNRVLGSRPPIRWSKLKRSRIVKDVFHAMHMFNIPRRHGLRQAFAQALRDAFYIFDAADVAQIARYAAAQVPSLTFLQLFEKKPRWVLRRCKRQIAPPEILYPRVAAVLKKFGPLKDAKTSEPLFNEARWGIANSVLDLVERGLVSDPPGVALYSSLKRDKDNFPLYRCFRGTNATEGGVHTHLRPHLPSSGASLEHVEAALLDFVLRHNLLVCVKAFFLRLVCLTRCSQLGWTQEHDRKTISRAFLHLGDQRDRRPEDLAQR